MKLLAEISRDGIEVWLDGAILRVRGAKSKLDKWKPALTASKAEIIAVLSAPANDDAQHIDRELLAQIRALDETLRELAMYADWTPDELAGALARRMCMSAEGVVLELSYLRSALNQLRDGKPVKVPTAQTVCMPFGRL